MPSRLARSAEARLSWKRRRMVENSAAREAMKAATSEAAMRPATRWSRIRSEVAGPGEDTAGGEFVGGFFVVGFRAGAVLAGAAAAFLAARSAASAFTLSMRLMSLAQWRARPREPRARRARSSASAPPMPVADETVDDDGFGEFVEHDELGAAADGGEEFAGAGGDEDEVAFGRGFFEGFEEGVLGGGFHEVGFVDDEEFASAAEGAFVDFGFLVFLGVAGDFAADDVDGEGGAFGFAGFVVVADEFFGDEVEVGVVP